MGLRNRQPASQKPRNGIDMYLKCLATDQFSEDSHDVKSLKRSSAMLKSITEKATRTR